MLSSGIPIRVTMEFFIALQQGSDTDFLSTILTTVS